MNHCYFVIIIFFIPSVIFAQDTTNSWSGEFSFGGSYYRGNINQVNIRSEGVVSHTDSTFEFATAYKTIYGNTDEVENNREFLASVKFDWKPYSRFTPFLAFETFHNIYKGYDLKISGLGGAKYRIINKKSVYDYSVSLALIYSIENYSVPNDSVLIAKEDTEKFRISVRPKIKQKIGDNISFQHYTFIMPHIPDFKDYIIDSKTSLTTKLTNMIFIDLALEYEFVSEPPSEDIKKEDIAFVISLIIKLN